MGRGAPNKPGLSYFPKLVDFYEDDKIFDLLDRHGPLGVTVYDCILCIVYRNGYYAEIPLDKLARMVTKMIGNKWVKNKKAVVQVVHFCSEIGLLDDDLMTKNIITSVGIQRRYYETAVKRMKRQLYNMEYWLLGKEGNQELLFSEPKNGINSEGNTINSEEIQEVSEKNTLEIKENKNMYNTPFPAELEREFQLYLLVRANNYGEILPEQEQAIRDDLRSLSMVLEEQIAIVKKATAGGWKNLYPLKKGRERKTGKNSFQNFKGRDYGNMDDLTKKIIE